MAHNPTHVRYMACSADQMAKGLVPGNDEALTLAIRHKKEAWRS
jgi:hypothetical protein